MREAVAGTAGVPRTARGRAVWGAVGNDGVARFSETSPLSMRRGGRDNGLAGVAECGARHAPHQPGSRARALCSRPPSAPGAWRAGTGTEGRAEGARGRPCPRGLSRSRYFHGSAAF